jgi:hypothetical protein
MLRLLPYRILRWVGILQLTTATRQTLCKAMSAMKR